MKRFIVAGLLAALVACDRDSDDDPAVAAPGMPRPVAVAGDDYDAAINATGLVLDGSKSYDPPGGAISHLWTQVSGTPVVLTNATAATATFDAPAGPAPLVFRLTVTGTNGTDTDEVTVHVKTVVVAAGDDWFIGYGLAGRTVTALVAGGTGPYTYAWTGVPSWLAVTGGTTSATLTFVTPSLNELQNFDANGGITMLHRAAQGRMQLTVTVTDVNGDTDSDLVNLSVGPFPAAVAQENAGLGEPVFLNGGGGGFTAWTWTGTKPGGSPIAFLRPDKTALAGATDQRYVYFVPDTAGLYQVIVTRNPGTDIEVIDIPSGSYVGVGNQLGRVPDPFKGECAACHAGQFPWLENFADPWKETAHAAAFSKLLDPAYPGYAANQAKETWHDLSNLAERTTGFSLASATPNDGWDDRATAEGFVHGGITWDETIRKHPKTAGLSNVQCEACHGPGSEHAADTFFIRKSYDAMLCGRCHGGTHDGWAASSHSNPPNSAGGRTSCNHCHSAQGYVFEMRAQEGADPFVSFRSGSNLGRPALAPEDRRGTTCQACHEPHKKTAHGVFAGRDPQLRAFGNVQFSNGAVVDAGPSANCFMCHTSRTDTRAGSFDMNGRRAPHAPVQSEMLTGKNGNEFAGWVYTNSPHGDPDRFVSPIDGTNRQCLTCHKDAAPAQGAIGYRALGGHTFNVKQGSGATEADQASNTGGATVAGSRKFTVAGGPTFLRKFFAGDVLTIATGADPGAYTVRSVDTAGQVTLSAGPAFAGGAATAWSITSTPKYNVASCTQCHTTALDFRDVARADYDGNLATEAVQDEISGLLTAVRNAVNARLVALTGAGTFFESYHGRVTYNLGGTGTHRTFPGPGVSVGSNPDFVWANLTPAEQAEWEALYKAAYNVIFVEDDKSGGIHNTGYAVNLLQSSYEAVTSTTIGSPFVPFP